MLAQDWLYGDRVRTKLDARVERHLKLPTEFNKHSTIAVLNTLAERIVFTDDVPTILYDMHDNRQLTFDGMLSSVKLPYDCFWIEYNTMVGMGDGSDGLENSSYGALIQRIGAEAVRMYVIIGLKWSNSPMLSTLAYVIEFNTWPPIIKSAKHDDRKVLTFEVVYAFNYDTLVVNRHRQTVSDLGSVVNELLFGIFLVTQPKVYSDEQIKWKASHASARRKANKPPLLEYRKIRLHITKPSKRYSERPTATDRLHVDTESEAAIQHRRYHKVMGHFRHYVNNDTPHSVWIEPHYRGDPSLGVTFTERDVSR